MQEEGTWLDRKPDTKGQGPDILIILMRTNVLPHSFPKAASPMTYFPRMGPLLKLLSRPSSPQCAAKLFSTGTLVRQATSLLQQQPGNQEFRLVTPLSKVMHLHFFTLGRVSATSLHSTGPQDASEAKVTKVLKTFFSLNHLVWIVGFPSTGISDFLQLLVH